MRWLKRGKITQEAGNTMFHVLNTYTRTAAMEGLPAESRYGYWKILAMMDGHHVGILRWKMKEGRLIQHAGDFTDI